MRCVAVTGTSSFLGSRVLRRLVDARGVRGVVAVDIASPSAVLHGVRHRMVDLTLPGADQRLVEVFREDDVETVVHAALFTDPHPDASYAHELESIGTLNLAAAAAAAGVRHVVMRSFTAVYGARGQNPSFLTEDRRPQPNPDFAWAVDKLEAEEHLQAYARRYPGLGVTILRFAPLLGPGVNTFYTRLFSKRVVSVVLGYDPLLQLLDPDDALAAVDLAVARGPCGVVNVVPRTTLSLLTALHLAEKVTVPVPHSLAYALADLGWSLGLGEAPSGFIDFVRFPFVADAEKARRDLGFRARYGSRDALEAYLLYRYPAARAGGVEATHEESSRAAPDRHRGSSSPGSAPGGRGGAGGASAP
jgi:UDP-glucose 4-epimerase